MTQFREHDTLHYSSDLRVRAIHWLARCLGILIHIDGLPYGSARNLRHEPSALNGSTAH